MLGFDRERVLVNVRRATTEDLLDRVTAYRAGMEPEALDIIESELEARGVTPAEVAGHAERRRRDSIFLPDGVAAKCSFCHRPAVAEHWGWHCLWRVLPVFPRHFRYCDEHLPGGETAEGPEERA
jgi:hypothetical protein